jgi:hypothetical protein
VKKLIYRSCVNHATKKKQKGNEIDVRKAIKTSEGSVVFEGELSQDEFDFVLGLGLSYLFEQGALPFKQIDEEELTSFVNGTETKQ